MRYSIGFLFALVLGLIISSCTGNSDIPSNTENNRGPKKPEPLTYLALGDSYTIGESVSEPERWPAQLASQLNEKGLEVRGPIIIAQTGWRTDDMLKAAKAELDDAEKYDLVTLSIGVNNEYQGWEPERFRSEFEECLEYAISKSKSGENGVFVVSIPDYGYTEFGQKNQASISPRIDQYNSISAEICDTYKVTYLNITEISRSDPDDLSLVAEDGLHPSGKQYKMWVNSFAADIFERFR